MTPSFNKKEIRVLLTSCGGLVVPGMIDVLKKEETDFFFLGTDQRRDAVGRHFVNEFSVVPRGGDEAYVETIFALAKKKGIDVVVPLSDEETLSLSQHRSRFWQEGISVLCSDYDSVRIVSDKGLLLERLTDSGINTPSFFLPRSIKELDEAVEQLGYPEKEVVMKPASGRGARGFWILSEKVSGFDLLFKEKPLQRLPYKIVREFLLQGDEFPRMVAMEYLKGPDFNVDVLYKEGTPVYITPIERIKPDAGPVQVGKFTRDDKINSMVQQVSKAFHFDYLINVELAYLDGNKHVPLVYEINPRASAPIAAHKAAGINLLYYAIMMGLGKQIPEGLKFKENTLMERYWKDASSIGKEART